MQYRKLSLLIAASLGIAAAVIPASVVRAGATDVHPAADIRQPRRDASDASAPATLPPERVKETLDAYSHWLDVVAQRNEVAGLATAVVVNNKVAFERTLGYADANTQEPITPTTVFRLASLSKAFATAVTGLLIDEGRFSWNTKLADALPFFQLKDAQASGEVTVRDILGQRLGLPLLLPAWFVCPN